MVVTNKQTPEAFVLYADDSNVIIPSSTMHELETKSSKVVDSMTRWFSDNSLSLNNKKTKYILFHSNYMESKTPDSININNNAVKLENTVKFLGITIDKHLNWKEHCYQLGKKLSTCIYLLRNLSNFLSINTVIEVYYALFYSKLQYGIIFWGNSCESKTIFKIQKKALRTVFKLPPRQSCREIFIKNKILTLPCVYIYEILKFMKANEHTLKKNLDIHKYDTRNSNNLASSRYKLNVVKSNPKIVGIKMYNKLPQTVKSLELKHFNRRVKDMLLLHAYYNIQEYMEDTF